MEGGVRAGRGEGSEREVIVESEQYKDLRYKRGD